MEVKLISFSGPAPGIDHFSVQGLIAFAARVSNPANQHNQGSTQGLINYLIDHKHWSPFEMAHVCLEITTTRDIARQMLRHRSFAFQEFSQRYANVEMDGFVLRAARMQDKTNRQSSLPCEDHQISDEWNNKQRHVIEQAQEAYKWAIANGIAKEQARCVLPEGNTASKLYMTGSIRSWIHYLEVRQDEDTQLEHRLVALSIHKAIAEVFPSIKDVL